MRSLLIFFLITFTIEAFAQAILTGKILNENGEDLVGVNVRAKGTSIGTITDNEGRFSLEVPDSITFLIITFIGYEDQEIPVRQFSGEILMKEAEIGLNQVVISGSKRKEKILDSPASISVVNAKEIKNTVALNLYKNLEMLAGVDIIKTGIAGGNVVTRGFNNIFSSSLFVAVDNRIGSVPSIKVNAFHLIPTTSEDIERIEVVRGPASALYGPNAASGVVHFITKSPLDLEKRFSTKLSLAGGIERSILKGDIWHAGKINKKLGYKISGNYSQGQDWPYIDPAEPDSVYLYIPGADNIDTLGYIENGRNNFLRAYSLDARIDYRMKKDMTLIISGGFRNGSTVEMTGLGGSQILNWKYYYAQARFLWKDLFVQAYLNTTNSGETYLLRTGSRVIDKSKFIVTQIQHSYKPINQIRFTYGFDALLTRPQTNGTLYGKYEYDDNINELGIYLQGDFDIGKKVALVGAIRGDYHNFVKNIFWSPRAAIVYKPAPRHTLRATYNRAFESPGATHLSPDVTQGYIPIVNIPLKAIGNRNGFNYQYANNPFIENNPLYPRFLTPFIPDTIIDNIHYGAGQYNDLNDPVVNNLIWDRTVELITEEFARQVQGTGVSPALVEFVIGQILPDDIDTVLNAVKLLNLTKFEFDQDVDPATIQNIGPLTNAATQSYEIGYKGILFDKFILTLDGYRTDKKNFISPIMIMSPNVFYDESSFQQMVGNQIEANIKVLDPSIQNLLIDFLDKNEEFGNGNDSVADDFIRLITGIPFGSITPVENENGEMILSYVNIGNVTVYGIDLSVTALITKNMKMGLSYSWMSEDTIHVKEAPLGYISLNAPKHKIALSFAYDIKRIGLETGLQWRWQQGFLANAGVYVGPVDAYSTLDLNLTYKLPFSKNTEASLSIQNLIGSRYQPFPGAPEIGRLTMLRVTHTF